MTSSELTITTDDHPGPAAAATPDHVIIPAQAGVVISTGGRDDAVERAFAAAVRDPDRLDGLLAALRAGRLWLPLPGEGRPMVDGSAVYLPTVRYLGQVFVPAYTSAARLLRATEDLAPGQRAAVVPHAVVGAADLARRLPPALGIALNPGASESVPVYPAGVAQLAAERTAAERTVTGSAAAGSAATGGAATTREAAGNGSRIDVGALPPAVPGVTDLLASVRAALTAVRAAREAAAAWLTVEPGGAGMVISVTLDDPADPAARDAVVGAVQHAVAAAREVGWPVDVTFPGEGEPDVIDRWVAGSATPFYRRSMGLPAPRPATA
jgi:hypothetical protein